MTKFIKVDGVDRDIEVLIRDKVKIFDAEANHSNLPWIIVLDYDDELWIQSSDGKKRYHLIDNTYWQTYKEPKKKKLLAPAMYRCDDQWFVTQEAYGSLEL